MCWSVLLLLGSDLRVGDFVEGPAPLPLLLHRDMLVSGASCLLIDVLRMKALFCS